MHVTCCVPQVLELALDRLGQRPAVHRVNPKAMPRQQLLGSLNLDTREWTDGVLTAAARKVRLLAAMAGVLHTYVPSSGSYVEARNTLRPASDDGSFAHATAHTGGCGAAQPAQLDCGRWRR
jgi:hypothetical protein